MGVEAARDARCRGLDGDRPDDLVFSTPGPGLPRQDQRHRDPCRARPRRSRPAPTTSSVRSDRASAALRTAASWAAAGRRTMAVLSDLRTGLGRRRPRSATAATARSRSCSATATTSVADRDRAAVGDAQRVPRPLAHRRASRRRRSGRSGSARRCTCRSSSRRSPTRSSRPTSRPTTLDHVIVVRPPRPGGEGRGESALGVPAEAIVDDHVGDDRQPRRRPAGVPPRRRARPGRRPASRSPSWCWPTAPTSLLRTTDAALPTAQAGRAAAGVPTVAEQIAAGRDDLPYARFLTWRGELAARAAPPSRPRTARARRPCGARPSGSSGFDASRASPAGSATSRRRGCA